MDPANADSTRTKIAGRRGHSDSIPFWHATGHSGHAHHIGCSGEIPRVSCRGPVMVELHRPRENPGGDHRRLAKSIIDEMRNQGVALSLDEARQVLLAETEDPKYFDESGHEVRPEQSECEACGSRRASLDAKYFCASCGRPTDPRSPQCEECGSKVAIPSSTLNAPYECERCGLGINDPSSTPKCPNCGHPRAVSRAGVK